MLDNRSFIFSVLFQHLQKNDGRMIKFKKWLSWVTPVVKNLSANAGDTRDTSSIPGSGRSPGVGNGNPLQYSCLEKFNGQRSLVGYSPWGCKEWDMTQ